MSGAAPAGGWAPSAVQLRVGSWLPPLGVSILVLALWEVVLFGLDIRSFLLPRPSVILGQLVALWPTTLARGVAFTGTEALVGLAIGVLLGTLAGLGTARWAFARETVVPLGIGASTVPIIAFAPIALNWFGPESLLPRVIIVALMVFFPVLVNTIRGLTDVDHDALELMASYAATDVQTLRKVRIPNALPYWFTALRIAATLSVIGAVVGEFFGGPLYSLGIYITSQTGISDYPKAWAAIILACALGIAFYSIAVLAERLVVPWRAARATGR
jgi:NitT/TauT family transport system permease protein